MWCLTSWAPRPTVAPPLYRCLPTSRTCSTLISGPTWPSCTRASPPTPSPAGAAHSRCARWRTTERSTRCAATGVCVCVCVCVCGGREAPPEGTWGGGWWRMSLVAIPPRRRRRPECVLVPSAGARCAHNQPGQPLKAHRLRSSLPRVPPRNWMRAREGVMACSEMGLDKETMEKVRGEGGGCGATCPHSIAGLGAQFKAVASPHQCQDHLVASPPTCTPGR
jgi:hypothetical protein